MHSEETGDRVTAAASRRGRPNEHTRFDVARVRADFPTLAREVRGQPLIYLDSAASAQTPTVVLEAMDHFYRHEYANVHRGIHFLSQKATDAYEAARARIARWFNARSEQEVVLTKGTTDSINLVAASYGREQLRAGDEVLITEMEHHSNIVPWQLICKQTGARLRVAPIYDNGELDLQRTLELIGPRTKIVAIAHVSNTLGTINPVKAVIEAAHNHQAVVLLDGAQAAPHLRIDLQQLDCDFYAVSAHKLFGPTGIDMLYGKSELLEKMPPYQGGGDMIIKVTFEETSYNVPPQRFEAGTPNIAGAIGFGAAIAYLETLDLSAALAHEDYLLAKASEALESMPGIRILGTAKDKVGVLSFVDELAHAHDIGTLLDAAGIAIRTGHHCTQPLMARLGVDSTARASLAFYNTEDEIDRFVEELDKAREMFR